MNGSDTRLTKLALLIDGDNVSAAYMPLIIREAERIGAIAVRRIYGQFKSGKMKSWQGYIEDFDLTPVNVSPLTRGKNATDMKLVIEAMDMLYGRQLDGFCIASSDGDFTPLAARIRANAIAAYGFGAKKAPAGYKAEFDRFFECDTLLAVEKKGIARRVSAPTPNATPAAPKSAARQPAPPRAARSPRTPQRQPAPKRSTAREPLPEVAILAAIDNRKGQDGWSHLGTVNNDMRKAIKDFSSKQYGYSSLKQLIAAMGGIETKTLPGGAALVRRAAR